MIIDSSPAELYCQMLMASIHKRVLPLTCKVRNGHKINLPTEYCREVLDRAVEFLPPETSVVLVGDGKFGYHAQARGGDSKDRNSSSMILAYFSHFENWIEGLNGLTVIGPSRA